MKTKISICNFSGVYKRQNFYKDFEAEWLEAEGLPGTNCYCDGEAAEYLRKRICLIQKNRIHFLDSGNYHYMSRLWMEMIQKEFCLVVFDHHTDMQPPAFGGILSCGGWIYDSLEQLPNLKQVYVIGPPEKDIKKVEGNADKVTFLAEEELGSLKEFMIMLAKDLPIYLSIDKDFLSEEEMICNWDQGKCSFSELREALLGFCEKQKQNIIGIDICGEDGKETTEENLLKSSRINQALLNIMMSLEEKEMIENEK